VIQTQKRRFHAIARRQQCARREGTIIETKFRGQRRPQRKFSIDDRRAESRRSFLDQESADRTGAIRIDIRFAFDFGPNDCDICDRSVANPLLNASETVAIGRLSRAGLQTTRIRAEVRFRQGKATELLAARHRRQQTVLLFFGAEEVDRHHGERSLDGGEGAQSAVPAFEFLHDQARRDASQSAATIAFDAWTKSAETGQLRHQFHRECPVTIMLRDDG
jgi:hypothetical protein